MRTGSGARLDVKATGDGGYWRYLAREQVDATDRNKRPGMDGAPGSGTRVPEHRNEQPPRSQGSPDRGRPQPSSRNPRAPQAPQAARKRQPGRGAERDLPGQRPDLDVRPRHDTDRQSVAEGRSVPLRVDIGGRRLIKKKKKKK